MPKRNRPIPGSVTVREIRIAVCTSCGCALDDIGYCDPDCTLDGEYRSTPGRCFYAVYKRTEEFLRDEPASTASTEPTLESSPKQKGDS